MLSIDENIQKVVENAGSAGLEKGAVVVMDPYTGEIRAAASFPMPSIASRGIQESAVTLDSTRVIQGLRLGNVASQAGTAMEALSPGCSA